MPIPIVHSKTVKEKEIALYHGPGGELAEDVAYALEQLSMPFDWINDIEIRQGQLDKYRILIIPGGITIRLAQKLGGSNLSHIRDFLRKGGGYIGICAGAYLATESVEVSGKPEGLDLIPIILKRRKGIGSREIFLVEHPVTKGISSPLTIRYQNGPDIIMKEENVDVIATYENDIAAIVTSSYGEGIVVLFSSHPEGSITQGYPPVMETMMLLKNSIQYCLNNINKSNHE